MQSFDLKEKSIYLHNSLFLVTIKYGNNSYYKSHIVNILFLHIFQKLRQKLLINKHYHFTLDLFNQKNEVIFYSNIMAGNKYRHHCLHRLLYHPHQTNINQTRGLHDQESHIEHHFPNYLLDNHL